MYDRYTTTCRKSQLKIPCVQCLVRVAQKYNSRRDPMCFEYNGKRSEVVAIKDWVRYMAVNM